jgi:hypothetical protein
VDPVWTPPPTMQIKKKLLNGMLPFPPFALLHSVTCVQLGLINVLGNCGCVAVVSFLVVPSA